METQFNDPEQLYAQYVLAGLQKDILEKADINHLLLLADVLDHVGLWKVMDMSTPSSSCTKDELVNGIHGLSMSAMSGDWLFEDERIAALTRLNRNRSFELREAELQLKGEDANASSYTSKEQAMKTRQGTIKVVFPLTERQKKEGWISVTTFLRDYMHRDPSPENIRATSLLLKTFFGDTSVRFPIGEREYSSMALFDYRNNVRARSYFINPVATSLILEKMGLAPMLPEEGKKAKWVSATEMALRIYGVSGKENIAELNAVARKIAAEPGKKLNIGTDAAPDVRPASDVAGLYRKHGTPSLYFFEPEAQAYFEKCLGIARELPEDKRNFIPEDTLREEAGLTKPVARTAIKRIVGEIKQQEQIDVFDSTRNITMLYDPGNIILRVIPPGGRTRYYIDPEIAGEYFSPEQMRAHAADGKDTEVPRIAPPTWISGTAISRKLGLSTAEDKAAVKVFIKHLHDLGLHSDKIGYFPSRAASGQYAYYADSMAVGEGKFISRESMRAYKAIIKQSGWAPWAAPER